MTRQNPSCMTVLQVWPPRAGYPGQSAAGIGHRFGGRQHWWHITGGTSLIVVIEAPQAQNQFGPVTATWPGYPLF